MSDYHQRTAYHRGHMSGHGLDWSQQPYPYKRYRGLGPAPMAKPVWPTAGFLDLALGGAPACDPLPLPDAATVSSILLLSAGITALSRVGHEVHGLRAPASAGALYPAELYLAAEQVAGLADGLYHFNPAEPGLHALWPKPLARRAAQALGRDPARLTFFITAIYWRSVWKYRSRAYRYCLLDSGHLLANLELALAAHGLERATSFNFVDSSAGALLSLAPHDEATLAVVSAGGPPRDEDPGDPGLPPLDLAAVPLSERVGREAEVLDAHAAGVLTEPAPPPALAPAARPAGAVELPSPRTGGPDLFEVVRNRRSHRNFVPQPLSLEDCSRLLAAALPVAGPLTVSAVIRCPDLASGVHRYHPEHNRLAQVSTNNDAAHMAARACLDQMWVAGASLVVLFSAPLERMAEISGPRSYRRAMLAAGRAGQRLYLAATALGLGCCGVGAFYDDELGRVMALEPGEEPLYLLACGPVKGGLRSLGNS